MLLYLSVGELLLNPSVCAIIDEGNLVSSTFINMPVDCVVANVHLSVWVPSMKILIACVNDLSSLLHPDELFSLLGPEAFLVLD
jgi:hypothetical protein